MEIFEWMESMNTVYTDLHDFTVVIVLLTMQYLCTISMILLIISLSLGKGTIYLSKFLPESFHTIIAHVPAENSYFTRVT